jgi:cyanophycin synthetase
MSGQTVGLACRDGLFLGSRCIDHRDSANFPAGQRLLVNRAIESAVIENGLDVLLDQGLAYDWCQVGVITRMNPDSLVPERYIDSVEQLYKVFRTQVDIVLEKHGTAVLNADDDQLVEMASLSKGHVMFFSANAEAPVLASHAEAGGRAVVLSEGVIRLLEGGREIAQLRAGTLELPIEGDPRSADDGLLAAIAAAWAVGIPPERIQAGLETLEPMPAPQVAA